MEELLTLTPSQLERLRMEDGLTDFVSDATQSELCFDATADIALRRQVRHALWPTDVPNISDSVMRRIGVQGFPVRESVTDEIDESGSIADNVMNRLGTERPPHGGVQDAIGSESGHMESVWPAVAAAIGADVQTSAGALLRNAVGQEAGDAGVRQGLWTRPAWAIPTAAGVFLAAAAALLLWVGSQYTDADRMAEKVISGPVDIEALDVGAANAVQVLQMGEEAPTIILVEPDEATE